MSIEIDGAKVLKSIANDPMKFGMQRSQVDALAISALKGKLIEKGMTIFVMRSIYNVIGHNDFAYVIESLNEKDTKTLIKLDAKNPDCKSADDRWLKSHLLKLASSEAELVLAPVKVKPTKSAKDTAQKTTKPPKIGTIMASEAQSAATKVRKSRAKSKD